MPGRFRHRMLRFFKIAAAVYLLGGVLLYFLQDFLLFHPKPLLANHSFQFSQPFHEENLQPKGRNLNLIQFKTTGQPKGIVLYFHGNMRNIERYAPFATLFTSQGYEVWMHDYPGFGKSTGKRTEKILYEDAAMIYGLAAKKINADSIVIYGKSIGTGIASQLASIKPAKRLILETPYYSIPSLANARFPIYPGALLSKYHLPVYQYLKMITVPVTIFHGTSDEVVPFTQALKLKRENPSVELIKIDKGRHNNLANHQLFQQKLKQLLP